MQRVQIISRKHGLQLPFNKYQISSWTLFGVELLVTVLVYIPPLEPTHRIALGVVMLFLLCTTFFCAFKSSHIDPTDPTVYSERDVREQGEDFVTELKHYCSICDTHVQPRTKHCGQCNRCVNVFDHHCQWLNNCVGARNYGYFAKLIVLMFINSSVKLGVGGYLLNQYYKRHEKFNDNVQEFYNTDSSLGFLQYLVIISCVLNLVFWLMMLQLIILHLWLHSQNLTTYEYIVLKRERMAAKSQKEGAPLSSARRSKVIKRIDDDETAGHNIAPHSVDDHTVSKLVKKGKPSVSYDHSHLSHFYASHDTTKEDLARHRTMDKPPEAAEPFGTIMTSVATQHAALMAPERKLKLYNQTPAAVLHETSMSNDFSVNETSTHGGNRGTGVYDKEIISKDLPESATKSPHSFSVIKERCEEEIATMRDQFAPRIQEEIRHITFPEVMECDDMSMDKSHETSKIMKFMETISENVVLKNPLGKIMFVKSGIDVDGSSQQAHLVKDVIKPVMPKLDLVKGFQKLQTFRPVESPHELKLLKSDLYYVSSPNNRVDPMFSPSSLLPNSCRIQLDRRVEHQANHSYVTERPAFMVSEFAHRESDGVAEDAPISKKDLQKHREPEGIKNPFFKA